MLDCKYVDENCYAAMLVAKRSTGVTQEVNLRILLRAGNEVGKHGFETQGRNHQNSKKQGYQWPHKKDWYSPIFLNVIYV